MTLTASVFLFPLPLPLPLPYLSKPSSHTISCPVVILSRCNCQVTLECEKHGFTSKAGNVFNCTNLEDATMAESVSEDIKKEYKVSVVNLSTTNIDVALLTNLVNMILFS